MNKTDIIRRVAYACVPAGASLAQQSAPEFPGVTITKISGHAGADALRMMAQELFSDQWVEDLAGMPDEPTPDLLSAIHRSCLSTTRIALRGIAIEATAVELVSNHQIMIAELQKVAAELGITYTPPHDPLLD